MDYHSNLKTQPFLMSITTTGVFKSRIITPIGFDLCYTHLALDDILEKKQENYKKIKLYFWSYKWPQTSATVALAVGLKSSVTAVRFGLRSNTGRARSKTLDFLQILRKEKVGKARILNYLCSFDVLSQEIAAIAAVRTSLWSKGCKFEHKKILNVKVKHLSKVVGHKENLEQIPKIQH